MILREKYNRKLYHNGLRFETVQVSRIRFEKKVWLRVCVDVFRWRYYSTVVGVVEQNDIIFYVFNIIYLFSISIYIRQ